MDCKQLPLYFEISCRNKCRQSREPRGETPTACQNAVVLRNRSVRHKITPQEHSPLPGQPSKAGRQRLQCRPSPSVSSRPMLPILYRDDRLIAIHKPSGLLVHRTALDRNETRFAVQLLRDQIGQRVYPVHRLDKGTSGVLLFALDKDMCREMSWQFERQQVDKRYIAVVRPQRRRRPHRLPTEPPPGRPGMDRRNRGHHAAGRRHRLPHAGAHRTANRGRPLPQQPLQPAGADAAHRPSPPAAPPPQAHRPPHHRRRHPRQGPPQSHVHRAFRQPTPAAGLRRDAAEPAGQRPAALAASAAGRRLHAAGGTTGLARRTGGRCAATPNPVQFAADKRHTPQPCSVTAMPSTPATTPTCSSI